MTSNKDFWPEDLIKEIPNIPLDILSQQAALLGGKTGNTVIAEIESDIDSDGDFVLRFVLRAPALSDYKYELFKLWHRTDLYPVRVAGTGELLKDDTELENFLAEQLRSEDAIRIIRALISQARRASTQR